MPCLSRDFHLRAKAFLGFHIGFGPVSGLREAPSASMWVPPRVPLWSVDGLVSPQVAVVSQGHADCPGPDCAAGHGSCSAARKPASLLARQQVPGELCFHAAER